MSKFLMNNTILCDAPEPWAFYFQDSASPMATGIVELHDHVMYFLIITVVLVSWLLVVMLIKGKSLPITYFKTSTSVLNNNITRLQSLKDFNHGSTIEIIWTIIPAIILVFIALPSFKLLYLLDEVIEPSVTVKAIGRQWYWQYEYTDELMSKPISVAFDSYLVPTDSLEEGTLRQLEVDSRIILPTDTMVRFIITAGDVLHSFAVPSLGIKIDAVPGRLNQTAVYIEREGLFFGQCSELCGVGHGYMPIAVEAVSMDKYISWLLENTD